VYLVTATRGEAGEIALPGLATPANLPAVREAELRCACQSYGIHPPIFLDYQDGQLPIVRQGQAVGKLVRIIRQLRPQVMITFGPEASMATTITSRYTAGPARPMSWRPIPTASLTAPPANRTWSASSIIGCCTRNRCKRAARAASAPQ